MDNFDRGLIKWVPFDALTGFKSALIELKNKRLTKAKPILSEDQNEILNNKLKLVFEYELTCDLYYYSDGGIEFLSGKIKKIDFINKAIVINNKQIKGECILEIYYQSAKYDYEGFTQW